MGSLTSKAVWVLLYSPVEVEVDKVVSSTSASVTGRWSPSLVHSVEFEFEVEVEVDVVVSDASTLFISSSSTASATAASTLFSSSTPFMRLLRLLRLRSSLTTTRDFGLAATIVGAAGVPCLNTELLPVEVDARFPFPHSARMRSAAVMLLSMLRVYLSAAVMLSARPTSASISGKSSTVSTQLSRSSLAQQLQRKVRLEFHAFLTTSYYSTSHLILFFFSSALSLIHDITIA